MLSYAGPTIIRPIGGCRWDCRFAGRPILSAGGKVVSAALGLCTLRVFCSMFG